MNLESSILRYLKDTHEISGINETYQPLDPDAAGSAVSMLAPWSLESISLNTGIGKPEVKSILEKLEGGSFRDISSDGVTRTVFTIEVVPSDSKLETRISELAGEIPISRIMNLHVYQFVKDKVKEENRPVKLEDALFDLKNNVFLPDDFMPEYLMGMVEGESELSLEEVRESLQIIPGIDSLYIYPETRENGEGRVRFLYPAHVTSLRASIFNETLREIIVKSFGTIQASAKYREFENSRLIKNLIFNIGQKHTRELRRPLFDPRKIGILEKMGLVEKSGEVAVVKESITLEDLKALYDHAKKLGHELSREWLSSVARVVP